MSNRQFIFIEKEATLCILMFVLVILIPSNTEAQSANPDSIYLVDGGVMVAQVIGLRGEYVKIIPPGGMRQDLPLDDIEKIVDSRGRIIYWKYRVSAKGFSEYLARSRGKRQNMFEVGATVDRRSGGENWTQVTPRIGWLYSPKLIIEFSGGRKNFDESYTLNRFGVISYSSQTEQTRKFLLVRFIAKFSARRNQLIPYSGFGVGRFWSTKLSTEIYDQGTDSSRIFVSDYTNNGFIIDVSFGLLFPVAEHYHIRAEARLEGWFIDFPARAFAIGISRGFRFK